MKDITSSVLIYIKLQYVNWINPSILGLLWPVPHGEIINLKMHFFFFNLSNCAKVQAWIFYTWMKEWLNLACIYYPISCKSSTTTGPLHRMYNIGQWVNRSRLPHGQEITALINTADNEKSHYQWLLDTTSLWRKLWTSLCLRCVNWFRNNSPVYVNI